MLYSGSVNDCSRDVHCHTIKALLRTLLMLIKKILLNEFVKKKIIKFIEKWLCRLKGCHVSTIAKNKVKIAKTMSCLDNSEICLVKLCFDSIPKHIRKINVDCCIHTTINYQLYLKIWWLSFLVPLTCGHHRRKQTGRTPYLWIQSDFCQPKWRRLLIEKQTKKRYNWMTCDLVT